MFKEFKDVKARDEVKQEESVLEKLITLGNEVINVYESMKWHTQDYIHKKLETLKLNYNEKDIVSLIRSGNYDDNDSKLVFGMYTGCLLTKLTEARHAEGKTTNVLIDGVKQDYLLYKTRKADYITINNCEGEFILRCINSLDGCGHIIINNCKGRFIGEEIGMAGTISQVIINNCEGFFIGGNIGTGGKVKQVIINNCEGEVIGTNIGSLGGYADQVIINNCKGASIGKYIALEGKVKQIIVNNPSMYGVSRGIYKKSSITQAIVNDPQEIERQGLTGLIELVDSLTGKSAQEVQEIAKKIGEYSNV